MPTPVPDVGDITPHIRRRVEDGPTSTQTAALVAFAYESAAEVDAEVGVFPEALEPYARVAASYLAAYKFERSEYPEQQDGGTAAMLREDYTDALARLRRAIAELSVDGLVRSVGTIVIGHGVYAEAAVDDSWS